MFIVRLATNTVKLVVLGKSGTPCIGGRSIAQKARIEQSRRWTSSLYSFSFLVLLFVFLKQYFIRSTPPLTKHRLSLTPYNNTTKYSLVCHKVLSNTHWDAFCNGQEPVVRNVLDTSNKTLDEILKTRPHVKLNNQCIFTILSNNDIRNRATYDSRPEKFILWDDGSVINCKSQTEEEKVLQRVASEVIKSERPIPEEIFLTFIQTSTGKQLMGWLERLIYNNHWNVKISINTVSLGFEGDSRMCGTEIDTVFGDREIPTRRNRRINAQRIRQTIDGIILPDRVVQKNQGLNTFDLVMWLPAKKIPCVPADNVVMKLTQRGELVIFNAANEFSAEGLQEELQNTLAAALRRVLGLPETEACALANCTQYSPFISGWELKLIEEKTRKQLYDDIVSHIEKLLMIEQTFLIYDYSEEYKAYANAVAFTLLHTARDELDVKALRRVRFWLSQMLDGNYQRRKTFLSPVLMAALYGPAFFVASVALRVPFQAVRQHLFKH